MSTSLLIVLLLSVAVATADQGSCLPDVGALDLPDAAARLTAAAIRGCEDAAVGAAYLTGMVAAEAAWRQGGTEASLAPVRAALSAIASGQAPAPARIATLVLAAAAAAAQTERDEMTVWLTRAVELELLQQAAGKPGAPFLSALEAAGDLWMRVDRYADALRAYESAVEALGQTPRLSAGLARARQRLRSTAPTPSEPPP